MGVNGGDSGSQRGQAMSINSFWPVVTACAILLAGCDPGGQPGSQTGASSGADQAGQPKRLVVASREAATALIDAAGDGGDVIEELVSAGLVRFTPVGEPVPLLAEAVPSIDNGLLKVTPDGGMETTWTLKEGAKWHDGTPITTDDLLFDIEIGQEGAINSLINIDVAPPPSGFLVPVGAPEFPAIKPGIVEYPFDPSRAEQLIQEIGYTRAGDSYRDAAGKELLFRYTSVGGGAEEQAALYLADSWQRVGVRTELDIRANLEREDRALRSGFTDGTGTFMMSQPERLIWLHSNSIPTPENRFRGNNRARYANPELDALIDRFFATIPPQERVELMGQIAHIVTDQVTQIVAYHTVHVALINNRVQNVTPRTGLAQTWDSHLWDIQ
ncbi:MAG: hypothetical protein GEU73_07250 [Chloroflexi bacterium]|nr:hypothetical protein [Chloroflexota bacterium]